MAQNISTVEIANDILEAVKDYRNPNSTHAERELAREYWEQFGATNQFHAILIANEAKKALTQQN